MDLVDIDKLIDNLELQVEQDAAENPAQLLHQRTQNAEKNCNSNKSFIGVSQVFTHLDDFAKNVESLETVAVPKYDIDCPLPINRKAEIATSTAFKNVPQNPFSSVSTGTFKIHRDDEDDEEASSDIKKFIENKSSSKDSPECDEQTSSSDSLTTSSSSTFSSGPSAGAASTTDERISPISPLNDMRVTPQIETSQTKTEEHRPITTQSEIEGKAPVEDLTTVLSSISISSSANSQSILPCETTVSSVLHNVLNELSAQTSLSPLSQLREETNGQQCEDAESIAEEYVTKEATTSREGITEIPETPKPAPVIIRQQPITFNSTMDEISDTELDSMLQEMDIDVDVEEVNSSLDSKVHENQSVENHNAEAELVENDALTKLVESDEQIIEDSEAMNEADSFSQASTVEFSEIRAQAAAAAVAAAAAAPPQSTDNIPQYENSYTSSESSSLEEEQVEENEEAIRNGELSGEEQEMLSTRPQRPTTLDLPALKSNLYSNAGQTPPGNSHDENVEEREQMTAENENLSNASQEIEEATGYCDPNENLGRVPPIWVPDNMAAGCMQCQSKFTMIKRRHHCRACGKVLCSICCSQKFKLEFLNEPESRVCVQCFIILAQRQQQSSTTNVADVQQNNSNQSNDQTNPSLSSSPPPSSLSASSSSSAASASASSSVHHIRSPNPNNPMEYCSTIPPHRQVGESTLPPPTVIVPVGVLKKDGSYSSNSSNSSNKQTRKRKSVMFSDGIAPGSDLAGIEQHQWSEAKHARRAQQACARGGVNNKPGTPIKSESAADSSTLGMVAQLFRGSIPPTAAAAVINAAQGSRGAKAQRSAASGSPNKISKTGEASSTASSRRLPEYACDKMGCFIPAGDKLPPIYVTKDEAGCDFEYKEVNNNYELIERLQSETLKFALTRNYFVYVKIVNLKCCLNKTVINFTTCGLHHVGNDEVVVLLEFEPPKNKELMKEPPIPKDILIHLYEIYKEAEIGNPLAELSYTNPSQERFLGVQDYGGFIFIRSTFQCLQDVMLPESPFLIGILIHRSEVPWAKVFPLRLMLRLGAQYRYYPCPHISMRNRESVYAEIAQTIINFLADFRNYSYTLPNIRGMYIHMEDRQTTVLIPRNRQEDIIKAMNNASDHILAFAGNFSKAADGHLVCMQNTNDQRSEMYSYSTQAINIQGQPRKVTGASFFVLNESLKSTSGLLAKCSIVEDGLMVQILPSKMEEVRNSLSNQKDIEIICGPVNAEEQQREIVSIKWVDNDKDFNIGVKSPIDEKSFEGISSMRVHASFNYANANYSIRLTDIFILKYDDWYCTQATKSGDAITRIAEQIARSASMALVPFLDSLVASGNRKIGIRATLHQDNVCYEAGACGSKLSTVHMNALDNNLIPILHNESNGIEEAIILELIFYILNA